MARRGRARQARLSDVLFFAGAASAATLTLSGFEIIASLSVPLSCIFAYNTPIEGCTANDFSNGGQCSSTCKRGLRRVQRNIRSSCATVQAEPNSLLFLALHKQLLENLCDDDDGDGDAGDGDASPPAPQAPSRTTEVAAPTQLPQSTEQPAPTEETTTVRATSTLTTSVRRPPPTSNSSPEPAASSTDAGPKSTVAETSSSPAASTALETTSASAPTQQKPPPPQETAASETTGADDTRQTLLPGSGGGSPFDFVAASTSWRPQLGVALGVATGAALFALL